MKYIKKYEAAPSKDDGGFKFNLGDYVAYRNTEHNRRYNFSEIDKAWKVINCYNKYIHRFSPPYNNIKKNLYELESDGYQINAEEILLRKLSDKEVEQYKLKQIGKKYNL